MPSTSAPAISVVMPIWNPHPQYFREAVESIRAQTLTDWELIVVEDPSPVSAADVLSTIVDARIIHLANVARTGPAAQRTQGLRAARSHLVALMDGDDIAEPQRLSQQQRFLLEHPHIAAVGSQLTIIDDRGRPFATRDYPTDSFVIAGKMRSYNALAHPSVMLRRDIVLAGGSYCDDFHSCEDYDLWCRLLGQGHQLANLPERLLRYRRHGGQIKSRKLRQTLRETVIIKRRHFQRVMSTGERLRCWFEGLCLWLPASLVHALFARVSYRPSATAMPSASE